LTKKSKGGGQLTQEKRPPAWVCEKINGEGGPSKGEKSGKTTTLLRASLKNKARGGTGEKGKKSVGPKPFLKGLLRKPNRKLGKGSTSGGTKGNGLKTKIKNVSEASQFKETEYARNKDKKRVAKISPKKTRSPVGSRERSEGTQWNKRGHHLQILNAKEKKKKKRKSAATVAGLGIVLEWPRKSRGKSPQGNLWVKPKTERPQKQKHKQTTQNQNCWDELPPGGNTWPCPRPAREWGEKEEGCKKDN